jgi:hypothetical protein
MRVYHRTAHREAILRDGFRDGTGSYGTLSEHTGVFLSNIPLGIDEGPEGKDLLAVEIPEEVFAKYEWIQEGLGYREALVPAEIVNRYPAEPVSEQEEEAIAQERFNARVARARKN